MGNSHSEMTSGESSLGKAGVTFVRIREDVSENDKNCGNRARWVADQMDVTIGKIGLIIGGSVDEKFTTVLFAPAKPPTPPTCVQVAKPDGRHFVYWRYANTWLSAANADQVSLEDQNELRAVFEEAEKFVAQEKKRKEDAAAAAEEDKEENAAATPTVDKPLVKLRVAHSLSKIGIKQHLMMSDDGKQLTFSCGHILFCIRYFVAMGIEVEASLGIPIPKTKTTNEKIDKIMRFVLEKNGTIAGCSFALRGENLVLVSDVLFNKGSQSPLETLQSISNLLERLIRHDTGSGTCADAVANDESTKIDAERIDHALKTVVITAVRMKKKLSKMLIGESDENDSDDDSDGGGGSSADVGVGGDGGGGSEKNQRATYPPTFP